MGINRPNVGDYLARRFSVKIRCIIWMVFSCSCRAEYHVEIDGTYLWNPFWTFRNPNGASHLDVLKSTKLWLRLTIEKIVRAAWIPFSNISKHAVISVYSRIALPVILFACHWVHPVASRTLFYAFFLHQAKPHSNIWAKSLVYLANLQTRIGSRPKSLGIRHIGGTLATHFVQVRHFECWRFTKIRQILRF